MARAAASASACGCSWPCLARLVGSGGGVAGSPRASPHHHWDSMTGPDARHAGSGQPPASRRAWPSSPGQLSPHASVRRKPPIGVLGPYMSVEKRHLHRVSCGEPWPPSVPAAPGPPFSPRVAVLGVVSQAPRRRVTPVRWCLSRVHPAQGHCLPGNAGQLGSFRSACGMLGRPPPLSEPPRPLVDTRDVSLSAGPTGLQMGSGVWPRS